MSDEEIDINGSGLPSKPNQHDKEDVGDEQHNIMRNSVVDLSGLVSPGDTNEELLRKLLSVNELIPWEDCWLPSRGIYYGWPDGLVKVRAMGQAAEKILATQRLAQSGQSIDYLFRECCQFPPGFDPIDLILGDRVFLLYFIRGITHGNMYEFAIPCPSCSSTNTHSYDLNNLASTVTAAKPELGTEPFKVVLPYLTQALKREVSVYVRFLRGADANSMLAQRKLKKKALAQPGNSVRNRNMGRQQVNQDQQLDDTISQNLEKVIVSVMGSTDQFTIRSFVSKMHGTDIAAVRMWLKDNTPSIDNTVTVTCPDCGHEFTVELPITESFFRPAKQ